MKLTFLLFATLVFAASSVSAAEPFRYSKDLGFFAKLLLPKEMNPVDHPAVKESCTSGCHLAFPAGILPEASWKQMIAALPDHYGNSVVLDEKIKTEIQGYLVKHAAENSESKVSVKIMDSLKGKYSAIRIMDIPYLKKKHEDLEPELFQRKDIRFRTNCTACHAESESHGLFNKGEVPKN